MMSYLALAFLVVATAIFGIAAFTFKHDDED